MNFLEVSNNSEFRIVDTKEILFKISEDKAVSSEGKVLKINKLEEVSLVARPKTNFK